MTEREIETEMNDRVAMQLGRLIIQHHLKDARMELLQREVARLQAALAAKEQPNG